MMNRTIRSNRKQTLGAGLLCLIMGLGLAAPALAGSTNVIGGNAIIPINPNFSPATELFIPANTPPPGGIDFLSNPVSNFLGLNQSLQVQIQVPVALGAALAQAISAGNRPSVLTPYSGILTGQGENAVFDSFGSLVTNKASTLGQGKLGIGLSYQHSKFDSYFGHDIGTAVNQDTVSVQNINTVASTDLGDFNVSTVQPFKTIAEVRAKDVVFTADVITLSLTYGLLDNLDVGALVPYIFLNTKGKVTIDVSQSIQVNVNNPDIGLDTTFPQAGSRRKFKGSFDRSFDGIGDIILFSKWQLMSQHGMPNRMQGPVDLALQAELKLPTGDDKDFLGTGKTDVALRMLIQREITNAFRVRGEIGYNRSGLGNDFNTIDYKAGAEFMISTNLSASAEFIGSYSHAFHGILDVAAGAKYSVSRDFKVFAGIRAPLNNNGLRYAWSPIFGVEYVFNKPAASGLDNLQPLDMAPLDAPAGTTAPATPASPGASAAPEAPASPSATAGASPAQPMNFEPAAPATAPLPASAAPSTPGSLALQPVQSVHVVGPVPAAPAPAGSTAAGAASGSTPLQMPGVRQP